LIAIIGLIVVAILFATYFKWYRQTQGASDLFFYLILVAFGLSIAALIFGLTGEFGSLDGEYLGIKYKFTGPIVATILVVLGFAYLPKSPGSGPDSTFTVRVFNNNNALNGGEVKLYIPDFDVAPLPITHGQAIFSNLPEDKLKLPIQISATCPGYLTTLIDDTIIKNISVVKINMVIAGRIRILGKVTGANGEYVSNAIIKVKNGKDSAESLTNGNYYLNVDNVTSGDPIILVISAIGYETTTEDLVPTSESNTKNLFLKRDTKVGQHSGSKSQTFKIKPVLGKNYEGGIIFYIEPDGKHGLIVAEVDQAINASWMIKPITMPERYHSEQDGYFNSENLVADQGVIGAYAALLCRNYRGGNFSDWFLPSIDQLMLLYDKKQIVKNMKSERYWSSTGNGGNATFLDFANKYRYVGYPNERYRVRAIREF
jgi:hypothetical protein